MTTASEATGRIRSLDGLRAVAILLVLVEHSLRPPLFWVGVDIFFVLSGFLITGLLLERKRRPGAYFGPFYLRRALRILPPYVVALAAAALMYGAAFLHFWPYFAFFGMNVFAWRHGFSLIPLPLWSLAIEEQFYFLWPLVVLLVPERWLLRVALAGVALAPVLRAVVTPFTAGYATVYFLTPFRADLLCAGAAVAVLWRRDPARLERVSRRFALAAAVAGFGAMAALQLFPMFRLIDNTPAGNGVVYSLSVLGSTALLLWTLADRGWWQRLLTLAPVRYVGRVSYTVYLMHLIFFGLVRRVTARESLVLLAGGAMTLAYATVSWFVLERPLGRLASHLAPAPPLAVSTPQEAHCN
jgi:peptidoglycan/LPS O-acetylase OafA/YrhL